jgi:hypothetical protein
MLEELDFTDWTDVDTDDPVEWVKRVRREQETRHGLKTESRINCSRRRGQHCYRASISQEPIDVHLVRFPVLITGHYPNHMGGNHVWRSSRSGAGEVQGYSQ